MIKNNKLTIEEIVNFITSQDIYYYNPIFNNSDYRDPKIISYIPIIDVDKNYKENVSLLKKFKIYEYFSNSSYKIQEKYQETILEQMQKVMDFKSIFEISPIDSIDKSFTFLINGKMKDLIYTVLDEKEENLNSLFDIFDIGSFVMIKMDVI